MKSSDGMEEFKIGGLQKSSQLIKNNPPYGGDVKSVVVLIHIYGLRWVLAQLLPLSSEHS